MSTSDNPFISNTLNSVVIASGFANDGQDIALVGQVASLTSTNNFINFCLTTPNLNIGTTNASGSCNPAPMGVLPSSDNIPSCKFTFPRHLDNIRSNQSFTITISTRNFDSGFQTNLFLSHLSAPQQLGPLGTIQGYVAVVIEALDALDQTTPSDPRKFAFFKAVNSSAVNGLLTADVPKGVPDGIYRLSSMMRTTNSAPVLAPVEQRGSIDDVVYFTASSSGTSQAPGISSSTTMTRGSTVPSSVDQSGLGSSHHPRLPVATIAGIVLAALCATALLATTIICFWRRRRSTNRDFRARELVSPFQLLEPTSTSPPLPETRRSPAMWRRLHSKVHQKSEMMIARNNPGALSRAQHREPDESFNMMPLSRLASADPPLPPEPPFPQSQDLGSSRERQIIQMFHEFLEARQQGLLPANATPPAYSDVTMTAQGLNGEQSLNSNRIQDRKHL